MLVDKYTFIPLQEEHAPQAVKEIEMTIDQINNQILLKAGVNLSKIVEFRHHLH